MCCSSIIKPINQKLFQKVLLDKGYLFQFEQTCFCLIHLIQITQDELLYHQSQNYYLKNKNLKLTFRHDKEVGLNRIPN